MNLSEWDLQLYRLEHETNLFAMPHFLKKEVSGKLQKALQVLPLEERKMDEMVQHLIHYEMLAGGYSQRDYAIVHWIKELASKMHHIFAEYAGMVDLLMWAKFIQLRSVGPRSKHGFLVDCEPTEMASYQRELFRLKGTLRQEVNQLKKRKRSLYFQYSYIEATKANREASLSFRFQSKEKEKRFQFEQSLFRLSAFFPFRVRKKALIFRNASDMSA